MRDLKKGSDLDVSAACPEILNQGAADPSHQGREIRKEKRCSKCWRRVYSTGYETKGRRYPYTRTMQGVSHITAVAEILKVVTRVPAQEDQNLLLRNIITKEHRHAGRKRCQKVKVAQDDTKSHDQKSKDQALMMTIYPNHGIWFDDLPLEFVDSYDDLKEAILENFRLQKKCIKDHVEILHFKQREGESAEDFLHRFKIESRDVKGATEVMRISGFVHGITNPELIKRLHDKIPKSIDEMMRITTSFLGGGSW
nr:reverse transcriptase domain-containing protein [Tanacetum cinerariifolium]